MATFYVVGSSVVWDVDAQWSATFPFPVFQRVRRRKRRCNKGPASLFVGKLRRHSVTSLIDMSRLSAQSRRPHDREPFYVVRCCLATFTMLRTFNASYERYWCAIIFISLGMWWTRGCCETRGRCVHPENDGCQIFSSYPHHHFLTPAISCVHPVAWLLSSSPIKSSVGNIDCRVGNITLYISDWLDTLNHEHSISNGFTFSVCGR